MSLPSQFQTLYRSPRIEISPAAAGMTEVGRVRQTNEDAYWIDPEARFLVVADGLGGVPGGGDAALVAVAEFASLMAEPARELGVLSSEAAELRLRGAFESAHACVRHQGRQHSGYEAMATTLAAAWVTPTRLFTMHSGDSRVYLLRRGSVVEVTSDHSPVGDLARAGMLRRDKIRTHPDRNMVSQVVGGKGDCEAEFNVFAFEPGDTVLLCTDGLWEALEEKHLVDIASRGVLASTRVLELLGCALAAGGKDNATVVLYDHRELR